MENEDFVPQLSNISLLVPPSFFICSCYLTALALFYASQIMFLKKNPLCYHFKWCNWQRLKIKEWKAVPKYKNFGGDGYACAIDCGHGFMNVILSANSWVVYIEYIQSYLNKMLKKKTLKSQKAYASIVKEVSKILK